MNEEIVLSQSCFGSPHNRKYQEEDEEDDWREDDWPEDWDEQEPEVDW